MKKQNEKSWRFFTAGIMAVLIGFTVTTCGEDPSSPSDDRPELTGTVAIDNTSPKVGDVLTASYSGGNGTGTATWQWVQSESTNIGTNSNTYTVAAADEGKTIKVQVSFADQKGSRTSAATSAVIAAPVDNRPELTGTVAIDNTSPKVGDILTAAYSGGNGTGTATWQWIQGESTSIGTNSNTYTVAAADEGKTIKVRISFANQKGSRTSATTSSVTTVPVDNRPELTGTVVIDNTLPKVGDILTASYSGGNGTGTATWQWIRGASTNIGTNSSEYTVVEDDWGQTIKVQVSFADQTDSVTSAPTAITQGGQLSLTKWTQILQAIQDNASFDGTLDLSGYTRVTSLSGILNSQGAFDPSSGGSTGKNKIKNLTLPDAAVSISSSAFSSYSGFSALETVTGANITTFTMAFRYHTGLKEVDLPNATGIANNAFESCTNLETVNFPEAISIGNNTFDGCIKLKTINFPKVLTIGSNAFKDCTALTEIIFPKATNIGNGAFWGCTNLIKANFPMATDIGSGAFEDCAKLSIVRIPAATFIGAGAFSGAGPQGSFLTFTAHITIRLGATAPNLGAGIFGITSSVTKQGVAVEVPDDTNWTSYGYSSETEAGDNLPLSGTDSSIVWGNGFRGKGWTNGSTGSGFINSNITLNFFHYND